METNEIKTMKEARKFLDARIKELGLGYHPDKSFAEYINVHTGKLVYEKAEALLYDRLMADCFKVFNKKGKDIYAYGLARITKLLLRLINKDLKARK